MLLVNFIIYCKEPFLGEFDAFNNKTSDRHGRQRLLQMVKLQVKLSVVYLKFKKEDRQRFIKNPMNFMSFSLKELSFINMVLVVYTDQ